MKEVVGVDEYEKPLMIVFIMSWKVEWELPPTFLYLIHQKFLIQGETFETLYRDQNIKSILLFDNFAAWQFRKYLLIHKIGN